MWAGTDGAAASRVSAVAVVFCGNSFNSAAGRKGDGCFATAGAGSCFLRWFLRDGGPADTLGRVLKAWLFWASGSVGKAGLLVLIPRTSAAALYMLLSGVASGAVFAMKLEGL